MHLVSPVTSGVMKLMDCGQSNCMVCQEHLKAVSGPTSLKLISEMFPQRWKNDFWGHQLPQTYHQLRARNAYN